MINQLDILCFGAHPDDVELGCGGTIALEVSRGKKVGIVDLTKGELGTRGNEVTRKEEASEAQKILGVDVRINLDLGDGFFENNKQNQLKVIEIIRTYQPKIVLCNAIDDRHIDHPRGAKLVSDACFLSGLTKIKTGKYDAWRPQQVYHYIQWKNIEPDVIVDISDFIGQKLKAVKAYNTQFFDPNSDAPSTPISSKNFLDSVSYRAQDLGRLTGVAFAEGFNTARTPLVKSIFDIL